ncbi:MAG: hypothetical protein KGL39_35395 [Patescibacteria group bacterium]|nr:hypothetical protein [Patescibacteria group bacterium]
MNRSLFRGEFAEFARQPTSGRARIVSGSAQLSAAGATTAGLNVYGPCGDFMAWKAASDYTQPTSSQLLAQLVQLGTPSAFKIAGYKDGMILAPFQDTTDHAPYPLGPLFNGTFPNLNASPTWNPRNGAYYWYLPIGQGTYVYYGGINHKIGGENDQLYAWDSGNSGTLLNSLSVRVINQRVYWLVSIVDNTGYIAGCWYKICGLSPVGLYQLVPVGTNTPPGTVISDWPEFNGLFNPTSGPTYYMHPATDGRFAAAGGTFNPANQLPALTISRA